MHTIATTVHPVQALKSIQSVVHTIHPICHPINAVSIGHSIGKHGLHLLDLLSQFLLFGKQDLNVLLLLRNHLNEEHRVLHLNIIGGRGCI